MKKIDDRAKEKSKAKKRTVVAITAFVTCVFSYSWYNRYFKKRGKENIAAEEDEAVSSTARYQMVEEMVRAIEKTGIMKTATELGNTIGVSGREVNKRLIEKGLAVKGYYHPFPTELGIGICEETSKETMYGHGFSNLEWDSSVEPIIFSPEEIYQAEQRRQNSYRVIKEHKKQQSA